MAAPAAGVVKPSDSGQRRPRLLYEDCEPPGYGLSWRSGGVKRGSGIPSVSARLITMPSPLAVILLTVIVSGTSFSSDPAEKQISNLPSLERILARMAEMDRVTTPALRDYTSIRQYELENTRLHKKAKMTVRMTYRFPGQKHFEVLSEEGSATIRSRVFRRMLESESKTSTAESRAATQITPQNYDFKLVGPETLDGRVSYVLEAVPRTKNTFLFRGRVWVDAEDFAVVRIEGSPAKNPSFWVRKTTFVHRYNKFGRFWLAVSNQSDTDVLVFGRTAVRIDYSEYQINQQSPGNIGDAGH